jgi:hypothetical protein
VTVVTENKPKLTYEQLLSALQVAEKKALEAESKHAAGQNMTLKVSAKGALSAYGLGRWPVTLYWQQWFRLLTITCALTEEQFWATPIGKFITTNQTALKSKGDDAADEPEAGK